MRKNRREGGEKQYTGVRKQGYGSKGGGGGGGKWSHVLNIQMFIDAKC